MGVVSIRKVPACFRNILGHLGLEMNRGTMSRKLMEITPSSKFGCWCSPGGCALLADLLRAANWVKRSGYDAAWHTSSHTGWICSCAYSDATDVGSTDIKAMLVIAVGVGRRSRSSCRAGVMMGNCLTGTPVLDQMCHDIVMTIPTSPCL